MYRSIITKIGYILLTSNEVNSRQIIRHLKVHKANGEMLRSHRSPYHSEGTHKHGKKMFRREEFDTYLTHACRHHCSGENQVKR